MAESIRNDTSGSNRSTTVESFARRWAGFSLRGESSIASQNKTNYSLFCLSTKNPVRKYSLSLVNSKYPFQTYTCYVYFIFLSFLASLLKRLAVVIRALRTFSEAWRAKCDRFRCGKEGSSVPFRPACFVST